MRQAEWMDHFTFSRAILYLWVVQLCFHDPGNVFSPIQVPGALGKRGKGKTVHVIFNNHLDIGFDGIWPELGFDNNVINRYFNVYFPRAVSLAKEYKKNFDHGRFVFTTHAYLISLFLDCPMGIGLDCPDKAARDNVVKAIKKGHITWHAYPFNGQLEMADPALLEYAVDMVHELDKQFGQPIKTTLSQRDVPGLTRAALPILVRAGVKAISVGVNGGSAPPAVPKNTIFIWKDPRNGAKVFASWHPGGYGGIHASDCVQVENFTHVLCPAWRGDNDGPPVNITSINDTLNFVRGQFPGAEVQPSTFEDYLFHLESDAHSLHFPVVTGEIGDTWIHGVQSDPFKVAHYRAALRLRSWCLKEGHCNLQDPAFRNFSRLLLKVNEHTWGVDIKQTLHDNFNWSNAGLQEALQERRQNYVDCVWSWIRQAKYIQWAMEALPFHHPIRQHFNAEHALLKNMYGITGGDYDSSNDSSNDSTDSTLKHDINSSSGNGGHSADELTSQRFSIDGSTGGSKRSSQGGSRMEHWLQNAKSHSLAEGLLRFKTNMWALEVDTDKGSFSRLQRVWPDGSVGVNWAGGNDSSFGRLLYSTYDEASFDIIWRHYQYIPYPPNWWFAQDFGKVNCTLANPKRAELYPRLTTALSTTDSVSGALVILLHHVFPDWAVREAGAPTAMWTIVHMHGSGKQHPGPGPHLHPHAHPGDLHVDVLWVNKTATRLPEALWLQFQPGSGAVDPDSWTMDKLGQGIKPSEVLQNGSFSLHAVQDKGVSVTSLDKTEELMIGSLDASLVSPGVPTVFPNVVTRPDMTKGMSYNLVNNIWGTNYVMWVPYVPRDTNTAFRFLLRSKRQMPAS